MADRLDTINGLHEMLDFLRLNPDFPLPDGFQSLNIWAYTRKEFAKLARLMGHGDKGKGYTCIYLRRKFFGGVKIDLCMSNETAQCRKVVTGQEWIPEETRPGHYRDKEEWICDDALLTFDKAGGND